MEGLGRISAQGHAFVTSKSEKSAQSAPSQGQEAIKPDLAGERKAHQEICSSVPSPPLFLCEGQPNAAQSNRRTTQSPSQRSPTQAQGPKNTPRAPKNTPEGRQSTPRAPKSSPRRTPPTPGVAQVSQQNPRAHPELPKRAPERPNASQINPKITLNEHMGPRGPKRAPQMASMTPPKTHMRFKH